LDNTFYDVGLNIINKTLEPNSLHFNEQVVNMLPSKLFAWSTSNIVIIKVNYHLFLRVASSLIDEVDKDDM
jgi:hypothetical protein